MKSIGELLTSIGEKLGVAKQKNIPSAKPTNISDIKSWLTINIAARLKTDASQVDHDTSFSQLGLDSLAAIGISIQIEQWLNTELDATILYQHPTISKLSDYLARKLTLSY